jgi:hypothetical protein
MVSANHKIKNGQWSALSIDHRPLGLKGTILEIMSYGLWVMICFTPYALSLMPYALKSGFSNQL